jgi:hypothetical protein
LSGPGAYVSRDGDHCALCACACGGGGRSQGLRLGGSSRRMAAACRPPPDSCRLLACGKGASGFVRDIVAVELGLVGVGGVEDGVHRDADDRDTERPEEGG